MSLLNPKTEHARVLLARGLGSTIVVIATDSAWVMCDIENITDCDGDLGVTAPKEVKGHGVFWLWEGTLRVGSSGADCEPETIYKGKTRPVTIEELPDLLKMEPPTVLCCECSKDEGRAIYHDEPACPPDGKAIIDLSEMPGGRSLIVTGGTLTITPNTQP